MAIAREYRVPVIDLYGALATPDGKTPGKYSTDGMHLNRAGYAKWDALLAPAWSRDA